MSTEAKKGATCTCSRTGKSQKFWQKYWWLKWLFPIAGLVSLIWFLIRVLPKPSRATYPCQRVAAPLASGFVVWIAGLIGSTLAYRSARRALRQSRYVIAGVCVAFGVMVIWWTFSVTSSNLAMAVFTPIDLPNSPMGIAKGINPGRVVWAYDPNAASWSGSVGRQVNYWWRDNNTDPNRVDRMMSRSIQTLVSEPNDPNAWDALFRHFNQAKGKGDVGYQAPEKIVVKINENCQNNASATENLSIDASPQMVRSLLDQLVNQAGVPQSAITVYDAQRPISYPVYNRCHPEFPDVAYRGGRGYPPGPNPNFIWVPDSISYSAQITHSNARKLPQCVLDAEYIINMAILKCHEIAGVTLCAKNHFGTIGYCIPLHEFVSWRLRAMEMYNPLVDLMGSENIGGKTILYIIDGLYGSNSAIGVPRRWTSEPFNRGWPSSIFVSQDPVAIDSVGLEFLHAEWRLRDNADNYLHEAAQADNPPSGTFYDPEADGTPLQSLGVHEHWNNAIDKQYSRNLGIGDGIELIALLPSEEGEFWDFTTQEYFVVDDFESYNDLNPSDPESKRIFNVWSDGYDVQTNGSLVGYDDAPFCEQTIVHSGKQSMPFFFDNSGTANYSEATLTLNSGRDWTLKDVEALSLWFKGNPAGFVEDPAGTYTMTAAGVDIWDSADQFRYVWKQLSGDGEIIAQVLSLEKTDDYAKAGVMIRSTLDAGSPNVFIAITGGGGDGATFKWRSAPGGTTSSSRTLAGISPPASVKLVRKGNVFTCYVFLDGQWQQEGRLTSVVMTNPVYIGLALTSHSAGVTTKAVFSDVQTTGAVSGVFTEQAIGADMPASYPDSMYVAIANSGGTPAVVRHDDPSATQAVDWTEWSIPLTEFSNQGVDLTDVDSISIGFGDKTNPQPGNSGKVYFDDIRLYLPPP